MGNGDASGGTDCNEEVGWFRADGPAGHPPPGLDFCFGFLRLARIASRAHAARVRVAIVLVVLLVLVQPVERAAAGTHEAADGRAFAGPGAAAGDGTTRRAERRARDRAYRAVLDRVNRLVPLSRLRGCVLIARLPVDCPAICQP